MSDLDRIRAQSLMKSQGIDALVLFQPENFNYATGAPGGVATMWRRAGAAIAIVPQSPDERLAAIASDMAAPALRRLDSGLDVREHRIWIDMVDLSALSDGSSTADRVTRAYREQGLVHPRPESFDPAVAIGLLRDVLTERGLAKARIGVDFDFLPLADFRNLTSAIPDIEWVDGSGIVQRLRAIKSSAEIERLRLACHLAEEGLRHMIQAVTGGTTVKQLSDTWRTGVKQTAEASGIVNLTGHWDFISVGNDPWSLTGVVEDGSIIKADVGCLIDGYSSDTARTFSFGTPTPIAQDVFAALEAAFTAGLAAMRPGATFGSVHAAVLGEMRAAGFAEYHRGHFGHAVGANVGMEEWPFISAGNNEIIEPGMVLALETPFYAKGVGALMIEDQLLVTEDGIEVMNALPRDLIDLSKAR
ncbi:M24 family metallopeptidase [Microvirga solisilvae]|uniref:M24 family metallopeptidase n=1 Tax=Microvirga solisilvae TaxID=2919498 RepID=UPI001FAF19BF|nr:Xaa-Pro peptidase family protein [Microvirga solisilvae]